MLKYFTAVILCVGLMVTACKKNDNSPDPNLSIYIPGSSNTGPGLNLLMGKWNWVKAINSITGESTPASTKITERVEFGTDSAMVIYRNNLYYYRFKYLYVPDYHFGGRTFSVAIIGDSKYETVIKNDTLTFYTFEYGNRDLRTYVRLKN